MNHPFGCLKLTFCLTLVSTGFVFAQSTPDAVPAITAAPVAYVYIGTTKGVYLYDAASTGKLTRVSTTPYQPAGLAIGSNGKYFISLGKYLVHSYLVASNGAIGKSVSSINTADYYGNGACDGVNSGTEGLATLAHTGKYLYVTYPYVTSGSCAPSIQTFNIGTLGTLTFNDGIFTGGDAGNGLFQAPTIMANNKFAYAASDYSIGGGGGAFSGYVLGSNGEMQDSTTFNMEWEISPVDYAPIDVVADPTNHLAAVLDYVSEEGWGPTQLASYTVDSQGNLSTTSTAANMPYATGSILNMSPSGKLLAVAGTGVQVFHFNGGNPITPYSSVLTSSTINEIHWDNSNHLYALSNAKDKLYVYTITPTSIKAVSGSPFTVGSSAMGTPNSLIVVSKVK